MGHAAQPFRRELVRAVLLRAGLHLGPQGGGPQLDRLPRSLQGSTTSLRFHMGRLEARLSPQGCCSWLSQCFKTIGITYQCFYIKRDIT